MLALARNKKT